MATQQLIETLEKLGIPATEETGAGWAHTEEYVRVRYGGIKALIPLLTQKAQQGDMRARIQLALAKSQPLAEIEKQLGIEQEEV